MAFSSSEHDVNAQGYDARITSVLVITGQSESADRHDRPRFDTRAGLRLLALPTDVRDERLRASRALLS
ncbi:hypothetical protein THOM_0190 [Trachipleistophora hominis]|uniref:Uncharacterized protein n=1 Tax=Trachipleistophora hominis TaxID=72359 RepID=L7K092_TRAHO|nr:hypothetical protein THOM_0190 [Trachipleistophora hominis]